MRLFPVVAVLALVACHTGSGGSPPFFPTPPPPAILHMVTSGITANAGLRQAVNGPDARVWFTEFNASKVAAVTPAGAVTEYPMPAGSQPDAITVGGDGNIWAGGFGGQILKITTSGFFTPYPIAGAHIGGMTAGPDGNIWYTDYGNDAVGKITNAGVVVSYPAPPGAMPAQIAAGSDGNLWVTDANGSILRVTTLGVMTQYRTGLTSGGHPQAIVAASDTNLYFTEPFSSSAANDRIGKVTIAGAITELGALAPNSDPNQIAAGSDGNLYFTESGTGNIGRVIVASGAVSETALGIMGGSAIVAGPDTTLWVGGTQTVYVLSY